MISDVMCYVGICPKCQKPVGSVKDDPKRKDSVERELSYWANHRLTVERWTMTRVRAVNRDEMCYCVRVGE